jgi:hypothetical protein
MIGACSARSLPRLLNAQGCRSWLRTRLTAAAVNRRLAARVAPATPFTVVLA